MGAAKVSASYRRRDVPLIFGKVGGVKVEGESFTLAGKCVTMPKNCRIIEWPQIALMGRHLEIPAQRLKEAAIAAFG